jgi:hypothetical protein
MKNKLITFFIFILICTISCKDDKIEDGTASLNSDNLITSFEFKNIDYEVTIKGDSIQIIFGAGVKLDSLAPIITVSGSATITPKSMEAQDFTKPLKYTVTAQNGEQKEYKIFVFTTISNDKKITKFTINSFDPVLVGKIDQLWNTITLEFPDSTDISNLTPTIEISDNATVNPASGTKQNFNDTIKYIVTAQDETTNEYTVITKTAKSNANYITEFKFEQYTPTLYGEIDNLENKIKVTIPWDFTIENSNFKKYDMTPTISTSPKSSIFPTSGYSISLSYNQTYRVTAENKDEKKYEVYLAYEDAPDATLNTLVNNKYRIGDTIYFTGTNFSDVSLKIDGSTTNYYTHDLTKTSFKLYISNNYFDEGINFPTIIVRDQEFSLDTIHILPPAPTISSVNKLTIEDNLALEISGDNFLQSGNIVEVYKDDSSSVEVIIQSEDNSDIEVYVHPLIGTGNYHVKVKAGEQEVVHTETIQFTENTSGDPMIWKTDKNTYSKGETITISGYNLTNAINIGLMGPDNVLHSLSSRSENTVTYTIPTDFVTGKYKIYVNNGSVSSSSNIIFNIIIQ